MELCANAERCGGCFYQGKTYDEELKIKDQGLHELLEHVIRTDDYIFEDDIWGDFGDWLDENIVKE